MHYTGWRASDGRYFSRGKIANNVFCSVAVMHVNVNDGNAMNSIPVDGHGVGRSNCHVIYKAKPVACLAWVAIEPASVSQPVIVGERVQAQEVT
jgi:hypothetical protein